MVDVPGARGGLARTCRVCLSQRTSSRSMTGGVAGHRRAPDDLPIGRGGTSAPPFHSARPCTSHVEDVVDLFEDQARIHSCGALFGARQGGQQGTAGSSLLTTTLTTTRTASNAVDPPPRQRSTWSEACTCRVARVDTEEVTGSIPVSPTTERPGQRLRKEIPARPYLMIGPVPGAFPEHSFRPGRRRAPGRRPGPRPRASRRGR